MNLNWWLKWEIFTNFNIWFNGFPQETVMIQRWFILMLQWWYAVMISSLIQLIVIFELIYINFNNKYGYKLYWNWYKLYATYGKLILIITAYIQRILYELNSENIGINFIQIDIKFMVYNIDMHCNIISINKLYVNCNDKYWYI